MKLKNSDMMKKINSILESYNQTILIVRWTGKEIEFNNNIILKDNDRHRFIRRILNKKTNIWKENHDIIMNDSRKIKEVKSTLARLGGKSCQRLYGEKIKNNLNTGNPWNKGINTGIIPWNFNLTKENDERLKKLSLSRIGEGNPMYGYKYSTEERNIKSQCMREQILSGKFTPNTNNRNTHWESNFDGKQYRSSWEALFQSFNQSAEFEVLRINYSYKNKIKVYIVDFIDYENKFVAEIKPKKLCHGEEFNAKIKALNEWATEKNFKIFIINEDWFLEKNENIINYDKFDERTQLKIKKFYEINKKN